MSRLKKIEGALLKMGQTAVDGIAGALEYTDSLLDKGRKKPRAQGTKKSARKSAKKSVTAKGAAKGSARSKGPAKKKQKAPSSGANKRGKASRKK